MSFAMRPPWLLRRMMVMAGHRRGGGWGFGPGGGFPMGPGPFLAGRAKVGRGGVRHAILHLLAEEPMHGYQIMQDLAERTRGIWQPSPGAVYPTLQQLEDEGLVRVDEQEGKKVYALTEEGRALVGSDEQSPPWEEFCSHVNDGLFALREVGFQVGAAVMQVAHAGTESQLAKTKEILEEARRQIYQVLAEADESES